MNNTTKSLITSRIGEIDALVASKTNSITDYQQAINQKRGEIDQLAQEKIDLQRDLPAIE